MSTLRAVNGFSITATHRTLKQQVVTASRRLRSLKRKAKWVALLRNNGKKLRRLANLVKLAPGWDKPSNEKQLKLEYVGAALTPEQAKADLARIEKVLDCRLFVENNYVCLVRLGRATVEMVIAFPWMTPLRKAA